MPTFLLYVFSNTVSGLKISESNKLLYPYLLPLLVVFKRDTVGSKFNADPKTLLKEFSAMPFDSKVNALALIINFNLELKSKLKFAVKLPLEKFDLSAPPTIPD